jgi:hypothetical protein
MNNQELARKIIRFLAEKNVGLSLEKQNDEDLLVYELGGFLDYSLNTPPTKGGYGWNK